MSGEREVGMNNSARGYGSPPSRDDALVIYKFASPAIALEATQAALKQCRDNGFQVAVAVVDRFGQPQVARAGLDAVREKIDF